MTSRARLLAASCVAIALGTCAAALGPASAAPNETEDDIRQAFGAPIEGQGATDGQALVFSDVRGAWIPGSAGGATSTVGLSDVTLVGGDENDTMRLTGGVLTPNGTLTISANSNVTVDGTLAFAAGNGGIVTRSGNLDLNTPAGSRTRIFSGGSMHVDLFDDGIGTMLVESSGNLRLRAATGSITVVSPFSDGIGGHWGAFVGGTAGNGLQIGTNAGLMFGDDSSVNANQTIGGSLSYDVAADSILVNDANLRVEGSLDIIDPNGATTGIRSATVLLSAVSGATVTASNLIPNGAALIGVSTRIETELGTGNGTTGYIVGDGSDTDRWAADVGAITVGTISDNSDATADARGFFTSAGDVVITFVGGNADGVGAIRVVAHFHAISAPTQ